MIRSIVGRVLASVAGAALTVGAGVMAGSGSAAAIYISPATAGKAVENISVSSGQERAIPTV